MTVSRNCIFRLSRYRNSLNRFRALGYVKIFSDILSDATGVTSSQVRKDFSVFGITGNKRGGYKIDELIEKLNDILGKNEVQKVAVIGGGKIGAALMKYKGFEKEGIKIAAVFDIDQSKVNRNSDIPVLPLEDFNEFVEENGIRIGVIAVPDVAAQQVFDMMVAAGIKGVLNFAPIELKHSEDVVANNVNLELELENVIYFVNALEKTGSR